MEFPEHIQVTVQRRQANQVQDQRTTLKKYETMAGFKEKRRLEKPKIQIEKQVQKFIVKI